MFSGLLNIMAVTKNVALDSEVTQVGVVEDSCACIVVTFSTSSHLFLSPVKFYAIAKFAIIYI